jgi:hypothetical protein
VHAIAAQGTQGTGSRLPHFEQIQRSFGSHDISGVQAHTGGAAASAAGQLGARAYAHGNAVAFAGAPDPHTAAHEAAHVVQQRGGVQLKGGIDGGASDPYEQHADAVADAVVAGRSAEGLLAQHAGSGTSTSAQVQRAPADPHATPGGTITVTLFDKNNEPIASRTVQLVGAVSAAVHRAQVLGDSLQWSGDPIDVKLGDEFGKDGKPQGGVPLAAWVKQAGKGRAVFVFVEVDVGDVQTQDQTTSIKANSSAQSPQGARASSHADGNDASAESAGGGTSKKPDNHGDGGGDADKTKAGEIDAAGHDGKSKNKDGEKGGTRTEGGRGKTGGADGSRHGKHDAKKRDIGYFFDPNHQHDGSQDVAPENADKDGMVGGEGKHGDEGVPDVGAWDPKIPIPANIRNLVAAGVILYQGDVQQIAKDLIKAASKAAAAELETMAAKEIEALTDRELAAAAKKGLLEGLSDAELATARDAVRAQVIAKLQAEIDAQIAGAAKNAAIDHAHSSGDTARFAADDLKEEQELTAAAKRARAAVSGSETESASVGASARSEETHPSSSTSQAPSEKPTAGKNEAAPGTETSHDARPQKTPAVPPADTPKVEPTPRPKRDLPHKPLTARERAGLEAKVKARTITQDEWERLQFDRRLKNRRQRGVDRFWAQERSRLRAGEPGTRNWTPEQRKEILAGRTPKFDDEPVHGHHKHNVVDYPDIADQGENIYPATKGEHLKRWHGGNFQNDTQGRPLAPDHDEDF